MPKKVLSVEQGSWQNNKSSNATGANGKRRMTFKIFASSAAKVKAFYRFCFWPGDYMKNKRFRKRKQSNKSSNAKSANAKSANAKSTNATGSNDSFVLHLVAKAFLVPAWKLQFQTCKKFCFMEKQMSWQDTTSNATGANDTGSKATGANATGSNDSFVSHLVAKA